MLTSELSLLCTCRLLTNIFHIADKHGRYVPPQIEPEQGNKLLKDLVLKQWVGDQCKDFMQSRKLLNLVSLFLPYFPLR